MFTTLWIAISAGMVVLLIAAIRKEDNQKCSGLNVVIKGVSNNFFVDKSDILKAINDYIDGAPVGQPLNVFNLKSLETDLQKNIWVKKAQLFFDNNAALQIIVTEREPVARVFTSSGTTFYIDSSITMLPLSEKFSARLPVFTNFPSDKAVLTKADSALLKEVYSMSMAIQKDSFRMALIDQVDITAQRNFELVPKIGNTIIAFGNAENAEEKFNKLQLFYKEVLTKSGWNYYSMVSVQYAGQVVAKRKDAEDKTADAQRTLQMMQAIASAAEQQANDSVQIMMQDNEHNTTDISLIQESIQRDDNLEPSSNQPQGIPVLPKPVLHNPLPMKNPGIKNEKKTTVAKPANKPAATIKKPITTKTKPVVVKQIFNNKKLITTKPTTPKATAQKPKAVMPKKNDY